MFKVFSRYLLPLFIIFATFTAQSVSAEEGVAAYYSNKFQGRKMVNGTRYDKNKLTAAHKTLPLGTKVKVTDLKNNKSVVVTITDRGPHSKKRMIDLSYAAAKKIGLINAGLSKVKLDVIK
jgi:rare lipoprotein A